MTAACEIGLENLTLTLVAERIGVSVQALYHYVSDKDHLLELIATEIVPRFALPPDHGEDWCEWAYGFAYSQRTLFRAVPGLAHLAMERTIPIAFGRLDESVRIAMRSGFDETSSWWVARAVQELVFAWAAREELRSAAAKRSGLSYLEGLKLLLSQEPEEKFTSLRRVLNKHPVELEDARFDYTLRALLAGLSLQRDVTFLPSSPVQKLKDR